MCLNVSPKDLIVLNFRPEKGLRRVLNLFATFVGLLQQLIYDAKEWWQFLSQFSNGRISAVSSHFGNEMTVLLCA